MCRVSIWLVQERHSCDTPGTFSDPDENDPLTLSSPREDSSPLPNWLTFDALAATFSDEPSDEHASVLHITVTASDSGRPALRVTAVTRVIVT